MEYSSHDVDQAHQIHEGLIDEAELDEYEGPEVAVLSWGYGEVWLDGCVTANGRIVFDLDDMP